MNHIIISNHVHGNAIVAREDMFVPIGDGLEVCVPAGVQSGDSWDIDIKPFRPERFLHSAYLNGTIYLTNADTNLCALKSNLVYSLNTSNGTNNPSYTGAKPLPVFRGNALVECYNHLLIATGAYLRWTDLDNVWSWYPAPNNEADFRGLDWEKYEITALAKVGNDVFVHYPNAIYQATYVGKPTIFQLAMRASGSGAVNSRAVQVVHGVQLFLSHDNFYAFGAEKQPIGNDIWKLFLSTNPDFTTIWSYTDIINHEVCWVDRNYTWAFNYHSRHWQRYSTNGITSHLTTPSSSNYVPLSSLETTSEIDKVKLDGIVNLWTAQDGVYREYRLGDDLGAALEMDDPYLETDDFTFGDLHYKKTLDTIVADFRYGEPFEGLLVQASGRDAVTKPSWWRDFVFVGNTAAPKHCPTVTGKVLRYRFVVKQTHAKFDGSWWWNAGVGFDGFAPPTFDGRRFFDGEWLLENSAPPQVFDGSMTLEEFGLPKLFVFEFSGYGHKVDLPNAIGPDK